MRETTVPLTPPPVHATALAELRTSFVRWIGGFDPFGRYARGR
jgi:hypothetical protein